MNAGLSEVHTSGVSCFESLYRNVTRAMEEFRDDPANRLIRDEQKWITCLVDGFKARYDNWASAETSYLDTLYRRRPPRKLVRFAGHAYLHIAFDLPVVIAESLVTNKDGTKPLVSASRGSQIFGQLEDALESALRADWERPLSVEVALKLKWDDAVLGWVVGLRNSSWKHAVELADASPEAWPRIVDGLHNDVHAKLKKALRISAPLVAILALRPPRTPVPVFAGLELLLWVLLSWWFDYRVATVVTGLVFVARALAFHSEEFAPSLASSVVRAFLRRFVPPVQKT